MNKATHLCIFSLHHLLDQKIDSFNISNLDFSNNNDNDIELDVLGTALNLQDIFVDNKTKLDVIFSELLKIYIKIPSIKNKLDNSDKGSFLGLAIKFNLCNHKRCQYNWHFEACIDETKLQCIFIDSNSELGNEILSHLKEDI